MGAGASTEHEIEAVFACTVLIGEAMMQGLDPRYVSFPDMFRIYDFHVGPKQFTSPSAGILIQSQPTLHNVLDDAKNTQEGNFEVDEAQHLVVMVDKDRVVLPRKDLLRPNAEGWTALHACCHTANTVKAGSDIIKAIRMEATGEVDWDAKTK